VRVKTRRELERRLRPRVFAPAASERRDVDGERSRRHASGVARRRGWIALAVLGVGLALGAVNALRESEELVTEAQLTAAALAQFSAGDDQTPARMRQLLGAPDHVFRDNPRALCWRYTTPYEVRMCWGPKRRSPWIAQSPPPEVALLRMRELHW
jgi:hypothetical protein